MGNARFGPQLSQTLVLGQKDPKNRALRRIWCRKMVFGRFTVLWSLIPRFGPIGKPGSADSQLNPYRELACPKIGF
jgi:hypothetical protein